VATGIALLRIVDPKRRSGTLEDFGLAFIFIVPLEIILISFSPAIVHNGYGWVLVAATVAFGLVTLLVARRVGWWAARSAPPDAEAPADEEPERPRVSS
jgi:ESS family glutamate:Na+ symporter